MMRQKIQNIYAALRPSERKVADYILSYQGKAGELLIEELAREAKVSQPTVVRFAKAVGYKSFREFKYAMMQEEMRERQREGRRRLGCTASAFQARTGWRRYRARSSPPPSRCWRRRSRASAKRSLSGRWTPSWQRTTL